MGGQSRVYSLEQPVGMLQSEEQEELAEKNRIFRRTMAEEFHSIFLADRCVRHDNLPLVQLDKTRPASRRVLVIWIREPRGDESMEVHPHEPLFVNFTDGNSIP